MKVVITSFLSEKTFYYDTHRTQDIVNLDSLQTTKNQSRFDTYPVALKKAKWTRTTDLVVMGLAPPVTDCTL